MTEATSSQVVYTPPGVENRFAALRTPILKGSAWILASTAIASVGGFLYWLVAARTASTAVVGRATALFASVNFVMYVASLGLPVTVARYGGARDQGSHVLFNWALVATVVSCFIGSVAYLPFLGSRADLLFGLGVVPGTLFFAAVSAAAAVSVLVDMRLTVQRRWSWVTARFAAFSIIRLPLLLLGFVTNSAFLLFAVAAGSPAVSGVIAWLLSTDRKWRFRLRPVPPAARQAVRYSGVNYLGGLAIQAPVFALPVLVVLEVSAKEYATFFVAWSITTLLFLLPINVSAVLLAEGGRGAHLSHQTRVALALISAISVVATAVVVTGASVVPALYGSAYARSADLLPLLVLAVLPWTVTAIALTRARVIEDTVATLAIAGLFAVAVLVPSVLLVGPSGTLGVAQGWLGGNCLTGIVTGVWLLNGVRKEERSRAQG